MLGEIKPVRAVDNFPTQNGLVGKKSPIHQVKHGAALTNTGDSVSGPVERVRGPVIEAWFPCHGQECTCSQQYNAAKPLTHQCGVCSSAHIHKVVQKNVLLDYLAQTTTEHHHACGTGIACSSQGLKRPFARTRSLKATFDPLVSLAQWYGALVWPTDVDVRYKMSWPGSIHHYHAKLQQRFLH